MSTPSDIFTTSVESIINKIHTCIPGIIIEYDSSTNRAKIQPSLNRKFTTGEISLPVLENVPIIFPPHISFPIQKNDYVLLLFSERSIDLWLERGGQLTPSDPRKYDLSDAIAIPGLLPFSSFISHNNRDFKVDYEGSSIIIRQNGDIEIKTSNKVAIGNSLVEVLDVLSQTLGFLSDPLAVPPGAVGGPLTFIAQAAALKIILDSIKGTIS